MSDTPLIPPEFLRAHTNSSELAFLAGCSERSARGYLSGEREMPLEVACRVADADPNGALAKPLIELILPAHETFPKYEPTAEELDQDGDGDVDEDDAQIASFRRAGQAAGNAERLSGFLADGKLDTLEHLEAIKDDAALHRLSRLCAAINNRIVRPMRRKARPIGGGQ